MIKTLNSIFFQPTYDCGLNCDGCIPAGALISTPKGLVPIEQIEDGAEVYAWDNSSEQVVISHAVQPFHHQQEEVFEIEVAGKVLQLTGDHPVRTRRGWVSAQDLTEDDEVLCDADHIE